MTSRPDDFDLASARLAKETRVLRNEARQLGHEKLAWLLGRALVQLFDVWTQKVAVEDEEAALSENPDGESSGNAAL